MNSYIKTFFSRTLLVIICSVFLTSCFDDDVIPTPGEEQKFLPGKGVLTYAEYSPLKDKPIKIHYNIPTDGNMANMPVLFVFPGQERNADDYLKAWTTESDKRKFMVFVFEFPEAYYSSSAYNEGGLFVGNVLQGQSNWTFSLIEPVFNKIVKDTGAKADGYDMWGHSAGAQFCHRFLTFMPNTKVKRLVSANAGWYTMPNVDIDYPYGLKNTNVGSGQLKTLFGKKLIVCLGTADTSRDGLNTTAGAEAQGINRFERGKFYFSESKSISSGLGYDFNWEKIEVPGVGHDYEKMAAVAAEYLY